MENGLIAPEITAVWAILLWQAGKSKLKTSYPLLLRVFIKYKPTKHFSNSSK